MRGSRRAIVRRRCAASRPAETPEAARATKPAVRLRAGHESAPAAARRPGRRRPTRTPVAAEAKPANSRARRTDRRTACPLPPPAPPAPSAACRVPVCRRPGCRSARTPRDRARSPNTRIGAARDAAAPACPATRRRSEACRTHVQTRRSEQPKPSAREKKRPGDGARLRRSRAACPLRRADSDRPPPAWPRSAPSEATRAGGRGRIRVSGGAPQRASRPPTRAARVWPR